ncbi:MAG: diguanylate cyclase [Rhodoferax sp.]|uniref:diguanylate cyclase n=1 Tax=Rhodoferax sp. TaxID=50421 RepID=UPI0026307372|nr:diguanylate cyclase [Rhodoferax sp.]MDD5334763.1 diguanylate cyclase [Rhodoferax sp.]
MLHHLNRNSFFTQWAILAVALLTLGGATGFNLYLERARTESREQHRLLTQAQVIQENLEQNLTAVGRVLADLRKDAPQGKANPGLGDHLKMLTDALPGVRTLLLLDDAGTVSASTRPELLGKNFAYRDYFKTVRQNPDPDMLFVSAPFLTTLGAYGVNVARTIPGPDGPFAGIIVATLDPEYFRTLMNSVLYAPDMWVAIAHGDGLQVAMVPEREGQVGKNLAQPGSFFTRHRDSGKESNLLTGIVYATGEERMMALRSIQPTRLRQDKPLVVAVGRDLNVVYAGWWRDFWVQSGLFGLLALGSTLGLYAYRRRQREFARKEAEVVEALAASERFMKTLTDNIPGMVAYWSRDLRCRFANKAYLEWFGRTPEQMHNIRIQDMMGDELFRRNEPFIKAALRGERQRFERTLTKADGSIGYTWAHYIPDQDANGVRGFFVLVSDITELKRAELALAQSEWKLKTIIETEPECVKVLAADGTLLQMNRAGLQMIEAESDTQAVGHKLTELLTPEYRDAFDSLNQRVNQGESGTLEFEIVGLKGTHRWLDTHAVPMRDTDGRITGLLGVTRDITARKQADRELKQLAQTDFLTNLANRRHFMALAEQDLSRTLRYGGPLSVLMLDIDHFKNINDTYGHKVGDLVLQTFGGLVRHTLRGVDAVGRVGGEEFAVVLPQTDGEHALEVAERLCRLTADTEVALDQGRPLHFTVSIGMTTLAGASNNIDTLLSQADQALYEAKHSGRNRVCTYQRRDGAAL